MFSSGTAFRPCRQGESSLRLQRQDVCPCLNNDLRFEDLCALHVLFRQTGSVTDLFFETDLALW